MARDNNKNQNPGISLVTVCHNSASTINATIKSVILQKDPQDQYIVIDGASTDGTQDVVRSYGAAIDAFISEPDKGIADAFNKGVCLASGDIVGLVNSDDTLPPGTLEKVRNFFKSNPDTEVLHGDLLLYEKSGAVKRLKPPGKWWYPWRLVLFNHPATFVRRAVYLKHGLFDTNYSISMDVEIFLRWLKYGVRINYMPEILAHMQAGGISGRSAIDGYRQVRDSLVRYGFSPPLAYLQYWGKVMLWSMLAVVSWLRRKLQAEKSTKSTT